MELWGILWPALLAGTVAIGVTVAIERWGGRVGGLIGTLPTTIVPASLGIYAQSADDAAFAIAMGAVPAGMLVDVGFLYLWRVLPPRLPAVGLAGRLGLMVVLSMLGWAAGAIAFVQGIDTLRALAVSPLATGAVLAIASVVAGVLACRRNPPTPSGSRRVGPATLLARGVLAGVAIAVSVWLVRVGGPLAAGMAAVFPAIFLTTMASLWISQGESVQSGAVGPMMLGSSSVSAFALAAAVTFPLLGPALGTAAAWVVAVAVVTVPAWLWLRRLQTARR